MWFDHDVQRLNYDARGEYLGEFHSDDYVLVILQNGQFYTTNFDLIIPCDCTGVMRVYDFNVDKVWTAVIESMM